MTQDQCEAVFPEIGATEGLSWSWHLDFEALVAALSEPAPWNSSRKSAVRPSGLAGGRVVDRAGDRPAADQPSATPKPGSRRAGAGQADTQTTDSDPAVLGTGVLRTGVLRPAALEPDGADTQTECSGPAVLRPGVLQPDGIAASGSAATDDDVTSGGGDAPGEATRPCADPVETEFAEYLEAVDAGRSSVVPLSVAAGRVAEILPTSPDLAAWLACSPAEGLEDGALAGAAASYRRLAAWAQAGELAAVAQMASRSAARDKNSGTGQDGRPAKVPTDAYGQVSLALTLSQAGAEWWTNLAVDLRWRLAATGLALREGVIDLARAKAIADATAPLDDDKARAVEARVLPRAGEQTTGQLRASLRRAVIIADPEGAERRREEAERRAKVILYPDAEGTATLTGQRLPGIRAAAAYARLTALARALKAAGSDGGIDLLRSKVMLGLLLGTLPHIPPPPDAPPDTDSRPDTGPASDHPASPDADTSPHLDDWPWNNHPAPGQNSSADSSSSADSDSSADKDPCDREGPGAAEDTRAGSSSCGQEPGDNAADGNPSAGESPSAEEDTGTGSDSCRQEPSDIATDGNPGIGESPSAAEDTGTGGGCRGQEPGGIAAGGSPGAGEGSLSGPKAPQVADDQPDAVRLGVGDENPEAGRPGVGDENPEAGRPGVSDWSRVGGSSEPSPAPWPDATWFLPPAPTALKNLQPSGSGFLDLRLPLVTLSQGGPEPGYLTRLGPITPAQASYLALLAAADPAVEWRVVITSPVGQAIAVPPDQIRRSPAGPARASPVTPLTPSSLLRRVTVIISTGELSTGELSTGGLSTDELSTDELSAGNHSGQGLDAKVMTVLAAIIPAARHAADKAGERAAADTAAGGCAHLQASAAYQVPARLREFMNLRDLTCRFPTCRQPAWRCDADHTKPYDQGGPTCLCNLGCLCRFHHQLKQYPGWHLDQPAPGTFIWTTPTGRSYRIEADQQAA
jgi:Domain of unknown function (DUF222)